MNVVLDTNVLVSALWSADSKPGYIVNAVIAGRFTACYDYRILDEYERVLRRAKFGFLPWEVDYLLEPIVRGGLSVVPEPLIDIPFVDESDRKFLEVARFCDAVLITGNMKHYPQDAQIMTVAEFYEKYCK